jgi:predicted amidohydrolase
VARYDKLHLFDVDVADNRGRYRESDDYAHGSQVVVADTPVGRLGLSVCYDLRFPELYSALRAAGAELITAPAAFTAVTGAAHWEVLIRARAIETQCYVLAAAQGGHPGPRKPTAMRRSSTLGGASAQQAQGEAVLLAERDSRRTGVHPGAHAGGYPPALFPAGRVAACADLGVTMSQMLSTVSEQLLAPAA